MEWFGASCAGVRVKEETVGGGAVMELGEKTATT